MLEIMKSVLSEKKQQLVVSSYGISYSAVRRRRNRSYGITNIVVVLVICDYISFFTDIFFRNIIANVCGLRMIALGNATI